MTEVDELFEVDIDENEGPDTDPILVAFNEAVQDGAEEDDTKMKMISAGATFKNVTRLYNQFMIDAGLAISKADRDQIVNETLEGLDFETEGDWENAVGRLADAISGSTERSAAALVRAYAKRNEMPCYTKPKGEGAGRSSFASQYYDFLAANPSMPVESARAYILGTDGNAETSENVKRHESHYLNIWKLVNKIATGGAQEAA